MLVIVATWLLGVPVLIVVLIMVVDVGNWFLHKRHLQLQADAGALAGGGVFTFPCSDDAIVNESRRYAGDPGSGAPYNLQVAPTDQSNVHVLVNSASYWNDFFASHHRTSMAATGARSPTASGRVPNDHQLPPASLTSRKPRGGSLEVVPVPVEVEVAVPA